MVLITVIAMMFFSCSFSGRKFPDKQNFYSEEDNSNAIADDLNPRIPYIEGTLRIDYIDVGQGDSIFIIFPDGKCMLIDGGAAPILDSGTASVIKSNIEFYGITEIDYLMLTHPHIDHCNALDYILKTYTVREFFIPKLLPSYGMENANRMKGYYDSKTYYNFYKQMELQIQKGAIANYNVGTFSIIGKDYTFDFYCSDAQYYDTLSGKSSIDELNTVSPIGFLTFNDIRYTFTGDANETTEQNFITNYVTEENKNNFQSKVLKVGHHGSQTSTTTAFLEIIQPTIAVISVGVNVAGHPTLQVLERLNIANAKIYTTKDSGTITITQSNSEITFYPAIGLEHIMALNLLNTFFFIPDNKYKTA